MKAFLMSILVAASAQGGSGGGVGRLLPKDILPSMQEILEAYYGASAISQEVYGEPGNFMLDVRNRKVHFQEDFDMSFEDIKLEVQAANEGQK